MFQTTNQYIYILPNILGITIIQERGIHHFQCISNRINRRCNGYLASLHTCIRAMAPHLPPHYTVLYSKESYWNHTSPMATVNDFATQTSLQHSHENIFATSAFSFWNTLLQSSGAGLQDNRNINAFCTTPAQHLVIVSWLVESHTFINPEFWINYI